MQVFGDGPDGGREATFTGTIQWASTVFGAQASRGTDSNSASASSASSNTSGAISDDDAWSGYTVIQSKFKLDPAPRPHDNAVWLQGQIKKEIENWVKAAKEHTRG